MVKPASRCIYDLILSLLRIALHAGPGRQHDSIRERLSGVVVQVPCADEVEWLRVARATVHFPSGERVRSDHLKAISSDFLDPDPRHRRAFGVPLSQRLRIRNILNKVILGREGIQGPRQTWMAIVDHLLGVGGVLVLREVGVGCDSSAFQWFELWRM
jgi:hypothetical protein